LHETSISIDLVSMGPGGAGVYERLPKDEVAARVLESMNVWAPFHKAMTLPYELTAEGASDALHEFCAGHTGASFALSNVTSDNIKTMQRFNDWADRIPWMGIARRAEDFRTAHAEGKYLSYGNAQPSLDGLSRDLSL